MACNMCAVQGAGYLCCSYVGAVFEVGVLPGGGLLARRGGQAVLQPEEDQAWQAQQLQGVFDESLDQNVGHEEGGGLRR